MTKDGEASSLSLIVVYMKNVPAAVSIVKIMILKKRQKSKFTTQWISVPPTPTANWAGSARFAL